VEIPILRDARDIAPRTSFSSTRTTIAPDEDEGVATMNGFSSRIGLELANQRIEDLYRDLARARLAKATSSSSRDTSSVGRNLRNALARPLGLLSAGR
jgi:hypothetical protein